jgi:hypothetical protein
LGLERGLRRRATPCHAGDRRTLCRARDARRALGWARLPPRKRCLPARTARGTPLALACGHEGVIRETAARRERRIRP